MLRYQGFVLGIKVRQTGYIVGSNGMEPLRRAIRASEMAQEALGRGAGTSTGEQGGRSCSRYSCRIRYVQLQPGRGACR